MPACAFVNSGFVGTTRTFAHDAARFPFTFDMLRPGDLRQWVAEGFETGAHTVNYVDLGRIDTATATSEVEECGTELRRLTGQDIDLFSFPFGRTDNITPDTKQVGMAGGYRGLFSAHGDFVGEDTDIFDIPREGVSWEASPLYCLPQIEGLTPAQIVSAFRR